MQIQLKTLQLPPRLTVQNKLLSAFGVDSHGRESKDLLAARAAMEKPARGQRTKYSEISKTGKKGKKKAVTFTSEEEEDEADESSEDGNSEAEKEEGSTCALTGPSRWQETMHQHEALVKRNKEFLEIHNLLLESKPDGREKNAPTIHFDRNPPNFHSTWKRLSRLTKNRPKAGMRGLGLIQWTTWEWQDITSQSYKRVMRTFAAAAIAESSRIISYRHELLICRPDGGAATIRLRVQQVLTEYLAAKDVGQTKVISDLLEGSDQQVLTEGELPPPGCISWADGIYLPTVPDSEIGTQTLHVIETEMEKLKRERALGTQEREVQKAVDFVQNLRTAWHNPTKKSNTKDKPALDDGVILALRSLVDVSSTIRPLCQVTLIL